MRKHYFDNFTKGFDLLNLTFWHNRISNACRVLETYSPLCSGRKILFITNSDCDSSDFKLIGAGLYSYILIITALTDTYKCLLHARHCFKGLLNLSTLITVLWRTSNPGERVSKDWHREVKSLAWANTASECPGRFWAQTTCSALLWLLRERMITHSGGQSLVREGTIRYWTSSLWNAPA